jgi:hypothetical protein
MGMAITPNTRIIERIFTMIDENATVSVGGNETRIGDLPMTSIIALLQRGINHVEGNEAASKVSTAKKAVKGGDGPDKDELKYTEAELEKIKEETYAQKVAAILEGTLGVRGPGVSHNPLAKFKREYAVTVLKAAYAKKKMTWPTGKGSGDVIAEMVGKLLNHPVHGPKATEYANERVQAQSELKDDLGDLLAE